MERIYVTQKEARAIFIKFLMENNCYKDYIICYKGQFDRAWYTPSRIFDNVIEKVRLSKSSLGNTLLYWSFGWATSGKDLCPRHSKMIDDNYGDKYWRSIDKKLREKYSRYFIE